MSSAACDKDDLLFARVGMHVVGGDRVTSLPLCEGKEGEVGTWAGDPCPSQLLLVQLFNRRKCQLGYFSTC